MNKETGRLICKSQRELKDRSGDRRMEPFPVPE